MKEEACDSESQVGVRPRSKHLLAMRPWLSYLASEALVFFLIPHGEVIKISYILSANIEHKCGN